MAAHDEGSRGHERVLTGTPTAAGASARDRSLGAATGLGIALGVFSVLADGAFPSRALVILGNIIAPWAIAAFAVGRLAPSWRRGGWAGTLCLLIGVVVYYVGQGVRFAAAGEPASDLVLRGAPLVWAVAAVTIGPLLGAAGAATARHVPVPVVAVALPSVVLLAEAGFLVIDRRPWLWNLAREPHRFTDLVVMVGLVALAAAIPIRWVPDRRRRRLALGVSFVSAAVGSVALVGLYRLIVHFA